MDRIQQTEGRKTDMTTTERLSAIQSRATLYEVVLSAPTGQKWLIAYTHRSGSAIVRAVSKRAERVVAAIGNRDVRIAKKTRDGITLSDGSSALFTGRTERECIINGEVPSLPR
jgi:hypothetical protein